MILATRCFAEGGMSLQEVIKDASVDMPMATSPASFLLGAAGENVPRLTSFRTFATQAARAYDEQGKVANAVAVELAPGLALGKLSWSDITQSQTARIWSRTSVSFATKVKSGDVRAQSAVGLQSILWAPAMDAVLQTVAGDDCTSVARKVDETLPGPNPAPGPPLSDEKLKKIAACQQAIDAILTKWNQPMLAVGGGRTFSSSGGSGTTPTKDSTAYWITGAYGADTGPRTDDAVQRLGYLLTAHYRHSTNRVTKNLVGTDVSATQDLMGINGRFGNARLSGIAEYSVAKYKEVDSKFDRRKRALLGLEYKIDKDIYLTVGTARDTGADKSKQSVLANINWGFAKEPVILPK